MRCNMSTVQQVVFTQTAGLVVGQVSSRHDTLQAGKVRDFGIISGIGMYQLVNASPP
jgi:hypothetical protein